jgi:hypothetical protein
VPTPQAGGRQVPVPQARDRRDVQCTVQLFLGHHSREEPEQVPTILNLRTPDLSGVTAGFRIQASGKNQNSTSLNPNSPLGCRDCSAATEHGGRMTCPNAAGRRWPTAYSVPPAEFPLATEALFAYFARR